MNAYSNRYHIGFHGLRRKKLILQIDKYGEKFSPINRIHARSETFLLNFGKNGKYQRKNNPGKRE